jgi:hypothetical protein
MIEVRPRLESARHAGSGQPTGKRVYFNALDRGSVSAIYSGLTAFASRVPARAKVYHEHEHGASAACFCCICDCAASPPVT